MMRLSTSSKSPFMLGAEPACYMTGGAGWKMAPSMNGDFELVDSLIMDGLLVIAEERMLPG